MESRDFKGVWIPKEIYLHPELSWTEKILVIEIDSLDNSERGCFASNEKLGGFLGISAGSCANMISKLKKMEIIEQCFFDGRNRGLKLHKNMKSAFMLQQPNLHKNMKSDPTKTLKQTSQINEQSNTVSNLVSNTEKRAVAEPEKTALPSSEISHLNSEKGGDPKEKSCAKKESTETPEIDKSEFDRAVDEYITAKKETAERNPAAEHIEKLQREHEAKQEAINKQPEAERDFNWEDDATECFKEACRTYTEIAKERNEYYSRKQGQAFINTAERFVAEYETPLGKPLAYEMMAFVVNYCNTSPKHYGLTVNMVKDQCKNFLESKKAITKNELTTNRPKQTAADIRANGRNDVKSPLEMGAAFLAKYEQQQPNGSGKNPIGFTTIEVIE